MVHRKIRRQSLHVRKQLSGREKGQFLCHGLERFQTHDSKIFHRRAPRSISRHRGARLPARDGSKTQHDGAANKEVNHKGHEDRTIERASNLKKWFLLRVLRGDIPGSGSVSSRSLTSFRDDRLFRVSFRAHREKSFFDVHYGLFKLNHYPRLLTRRHPCARDMRRRSFRSLAGR
jgi:hypothetical protein